MNRPVTPIRFLALLASGAMVLPAQQEQARHPLRLCFVGDPDTPRTHAFTAFLQQGFAAVEVASRDAGDPARLQKADVVLLDWPQGDAARARRARGWSPLGPRSGWHTPTVLLGSAGLNLAGAWQVRGGFG